MSTKIQKIQIKEFKILKDLEHDINGANIMIVGENGVGKSSLLQFIEIALGKSTNIPPDAKGKGVVFVDKDGEKYALKVEVKDGKSVVTIENEGGLKDNRKGTLKGLFGAVDFDIDEFVELSKSTAGRKKQVEIFKSFLPTDIQMALGTFEANIKSNYDERTQIGKDKKAAQGAITTNPMNNFPDTELAKMVEVDTVELTKQLSEAAEYNKKVSEVKNRCVSRFSDIEKANKEIETREKKMEEIMKEIEGYKTEVKENEKLNTQAEEWLKQNPEKDTTAINTQLSDAGTINRKASQAKELLKQRADYLKLVEEEGEMTVKIELERQAVADAIRDCDMPVDGLIFEDEELKWNGIPVNPDSLSTSEIMELGIKLKMSENPDLGVLVIQRGESLGKKRLEEIMELANKNNWQILMEQVQRGQEKLKIELLAV